MTFAHDFRRHVVPRMRREADRAASQLAFDLLEWGDAIADVVAVGRRYGFTSLTPEDQGSVLEWVSGRLLEQLVEREIALDSAQTNLEHQEAADPIVYYDALAAASLEPERMRWAFAAISPPYREHLLAQKRRHQPALADAT